LIIELIALAIGFTVLVWSADRFVFAAAGIALKLGMSTLMIGLTIVAFGTSAPEIFVSGLASLDGAPGLAIGNAVGSNIANMGLVLGAALLLGAITLPKQITHKELPKLLLVTAAVGVMFYDLMLNRFDGFVLLALLMAYLVLLFFSGKSNPEEAGISIEEELPDTTGQKLPKLILIFAIALVMLIGSSQLLVWAASAIAEKLGVDDVIIGLTIVAIGTSLPELAAAIASALKKHHDMVLGNVVGSNLLNLLTVLPLPALIQPSMIDAVVFNRDYTAMAITTGLVALFAFTSRKAILNQWHGAVLLSAYFAYLGLLYWQTTQI